MLKNLINKFEKTSLHVLFWVGLILAILFSELIGLTTVYIWKREISGFYFFLGFITPLLDGSLVIAFFTLAIRQLREIRKSLTEEISQHQHAKKELIAAREVAEDATRSKSEFLANMSHEIRTPMNGIMGMTDILLDMELSAEQKEVADTIKASGASLLTIINDILDFSKIEAGKLNLEAVNFDFRDMMEQIGKMLGVLAKAKDSSLSCQIAEDVPQYLVGDPVRLRQIIINYTNNALKFSNRKPVVIHASVEKKQAKKIRLRLAVSDKGIGIPAEKFGVLFHSFSQVDTSTTRKFGGTGLGLTIAKKLSELMNGEVGVESMVGKGSTFWAIVELGIGERTVQLKDADQHEEVEMDKTAVHILIAEDNIINQKVATMTLEKMGYTADIAENGRVAVDMLKIGEYHIVLMDVQMPEMDGYEATKAIRNGDAHEFNKNIHIIAMTANAMKGDREKCLAAGMNDFVAKPVNRRELKSAIIHFLQHAEMKIQDVV
ncbi:response regulator [candidate division KSB1 bacterium]|nr:response regulator [candidate division KSB1 bacterium]